MKTNFILAMIATLMLTASCSKSDSNKLDELDPKAPDTSQQLDQMDAEYEAITGKKSHLPSGVGTCRRNDCPVFALIDKETQTMQLFVKGKLEYEWQVSTGISEGYETPNFDRNPDGRIYDAYTSRKFPGGDYKGLGNMPYAVFIRGGYAIHGTSRGNWRKLGNKASHGCIRIHPENAYLFNQLVRQYGVEKVWITVQ